FAAVTIGMFLVWHFPPDERFVLPLFPLALVGLIAEVEHFAGLLRRSLHHRDRVQRVVAAGMMTAAAMLFGGALALQFYVAAVFQPAQAREDRANLARHRAAYDWVRANVPQQTAFLAYSDPLFHLYTGLPVTRRPILPIMWYHEDDAGLID